MENVVVQPPERLGAPGAHAFPDASSLSIIDLGRPDQEELPKDFDILS